MDARAVFGAAARTATAPAAAVDNTAVAKIALQSKQISTGVTTTTSVVVGQPGAPFSSSSSSKPEAAPQKDAQALMSKRVEAATYAMDVSKQIVRRSINFEDEKFLRKLLKKGLKEDKQWQAAFREYCTSRGVSADADPKGLDKDFIATFIERNLFNSITSDWAKKIIDNKDDPDEKKEKKDKKDKKAKKEKDGKKKEKKRKASDASSSEDAAGAASDGGAGGAAGTGPLQAPPVQLPPPPLPPQMEMQHPMGVHMFGGPPGMPMGMGSMSSMFPPGMGGMPMWPPMPGAGVDVPEDDRARKKEKSKMGASSPMSQTVGSMGMGDSMMESVMSPNADSPLSRQSSSSARSRALKIAQSLSMGMDMECDDL